LSAACAHFHDIIPRLACWLLAHDRLQLDEMHFTQQDMAGILGVRRVGITRAAGWLQGQGLIGYHRGAIRILIGQVYNRRHAAVMYCLRAIMHRWFAIPEPACRAACGGVTVACGQSTRGYRGIILLVHCGKFLWSAQYM
jgi:hypothetical protein